LIIVLYVLLGGLCGVAATVYIRGRYALEDLFDRIPNTYLRHCGGMLLVGGLIYSLYLGFGHYFVKGVG
jgi:chloride channel protein, CIC family